MSAKQLILKQPNLISGVLLFLPIRLPHNGLKHIVGWVKERPTVMWQPDRQVTFIISV